MRVVRECKAADSALFALAAVLRDVEIRIGNAGEIGFAVHVALAHDAGIDRKGVESKVHLGVGGRQKDAFDPRAPRCARQHGKWNVMNEADAIAVGIA